MSLRNAYEIVKSAAVDFVGDNAMRRGASVAFYAAMSMAPPAADGEPMPPETFFAKRA